MAKDFVVYNAENLKKINSMRRAASAPGETDVPILPASAVLFSAAAEANNEPRSCYNCAFYNAGQSCQLFGPHIPLRKFTFPPAAIPDSKQIEYWPVCGYWIYGEPHEGTPKFLATLDPDSAGLGWINAPARGLPHSGSCCGGRNGGDECDFWVTEGADARAEAAGFCRVLGRQTENMDCCAAWQDDDWVLWNRGVEIVREHPDD